MSRMKANDDKKTDQFSRWDPRRGQGLQHMADSEPDWERLQKINPFARGIAQRKAKDNQPIQRAIAGEERNGSWVYAYGMFFWDSRVGSPEDVTAIYGNDGYYIEVGRTYTADTGKTITMLANGMVQRQGDAKPYKAKDMAGLFDHLRSARANPNAKLPTPTKHQKGNVTSGEKKQEPTDHTGGKIETPKKILPAQELTPLKPLNLTDEIGWAFEEKINGRKIGDPVEKTSKEVIADEEGNGAGGKDSESTVILSEEQRDFEEETRWWLKILKSVNALSPEEKNQLLQAFRDFANAFENMVFWIPILNKLPGWLRSLADAAEKGIDWEQLEEEAVSRLNAGKKASKSLGAQEKRPNTEREAKKTKREKFRKREKEKKPLKYDFKPPNDRHKGTKVNIKSVTKDQNSVVDSTVNMKDDTKNINSGKATEARNPNNGRMQYTLPNGRTYEDHDGTLYPFSGPGVYPMDRGEYKALGAIQTMGLENPNLEKCITGNKIHKKTFLYAVKVYFLLRK